jgi:glycosyltransferase involved in cell wall biosynthesis
MKNVLSISYHYPPVGGAAVQRNAQIVRHLPLFGYQPIIVTGEGTRATRWTPRDDSLVRDATGDFRVIRMAGEDEIPESRTWRGRAERWLGGERPWSKWWTSSVREAVESISDDIDVIYAPIVPYDTFRAALRVRELLERPLVIDLHDPWAFDEMMVYPTRAHRQSAAHLMRRVLMTSDGIVINTPDATARILHAFPKLAERSVVTIPNGYSSDDFVGEQPPRGDGIFRIVHTGYLHTELGQEHRRLRFLHGVLGGTLGDVDILTRSHVYLLRAVEELLEETPGLGPIEIHLAGVATPADRQAAAGSKLVHFHGYVPHSESVRLLRSADLLFLPMHDLTDGRRAGIIPGKTYEYLAAERPILAAIPPGDAKDLLLEAGNAIVCDPKDVAGMKREVRAAIERNRAGQDDRRPEERVLARIEWRNRSHELARLFDSLCAGGNAVGSHEAAVAST